MQINKKKFVMKCVSEYNFRTTLYASEQFHNNNGLSCRLLTIGNNYDSVLHPDRPMHEALF